MDRSDIDRIISFMHDMREESKKLEEHQAPDGYVNERKARAFLEDGIVAGVIIGIVTPDGCMIGFLNAQWYSDYLNAYELLLYVKPERRGDGFARYLVAEFERIAKDRGAKAVIAGSSLDTFERIEGFYGSLGYSREALSMRKSLSV